MLTDWKIPATLDEAYDRKRILVAEVEEIDTQLSDHAKRIAAQDTDGRAAFHAWRQKAKWARTNRLQELRLVKDWIRKNA